jgi:hypothetical protein
MHCRGVAISQGNFGVVARWGFWDGSNGFGWSKAFYYHNLEMPSILYVIHFGYRTGSPSNKNYDVIHINASGNPDQEVNVVADTADSSFQGVETPDGRDVGVITGFCDDGSGALESQCPDWVNTDFGG